MGASRFLQIARTARHLPPSQLLRRVRFLWRRRRYAAAPHRPIARARRDAERAGFAASAKVVRLAPSLLDPGDAAARRNRAENVRRGVFRFLNRERDYAAGIRWRDPDVSPLWAYQLHYLGPLLDLVLEGDLEAATALLASWRDRFGATWDPVSWHPYPVSVRLTNVCLAAGVAGGLHKLGETTPALVADHAAFLLRNLETDVRGNHLLENALALLVVSRSLDGPLSQRCRAVGERVVRAELPEQIIADGAHFELSPMYHAALLHRIEQVAALLGLDPLTAEVLRPYGELMAAFLQGVVCPDGDVPLLGDSVRGFVPHAGAILDNARRLGWDVVEQHTESLVVYAGAGLGVWHGRGLWAVLDAGRVCPEALPAHGQADTLTVEVWLDGHCIVVDPGVHDYTGLERAWGRSSRAHSTITLDDRDNSEVYGSFRVGGRAEVLGLDVDGDRVEARVRPWNGAATYVRAVRFGDGARRSLEIVDRVEGGRDAVARARLHLHPAVTVVELRDADRLAVLETPAGPVHVRAEHPLHTEEARASREYGLIERTTVLVQQLLGAGEGDRTGSFLIGPAGGRRR